MDIHVHIQPWDQLKPEVAAAMKRGRDDIELVERFIRDPAAFTAFLDEQGVARVGLINYPSPDLMGFDERVNDFVAAYRDQHPDRIVAFGGMHPRFVTDPRREMHRLLHELRLDAIKLHPPHMLVHANAYLVARRLWLRTSGPYRCGNGPRPRPNWLPSMFNVARRLRCLAPLAARRPVSTNLPATTQRLHRRRRRSSAPSAP